MAIKPKKITIDASKKQKSDTKSKLFTYVLKRKQKKKQFPMQKCNILPV